jgi:hypothetical protein
VYNRHNAEVPLGGLSTYYIYGGKEFAIPSLNTYASLKVNEDYTNYLHKFYEALAGRPMSNRRNRSIAVDSQYEIKENVLWQPVTGKKNAYRMVGLSETETDVWPSLNNRPVCLFPVGLSRENTLYAIPAEVNGRDCDIIVLINERHPQGLVEGAKHKDGPIIQKGYDPIEPGDSIALYSLEINPNLKTKWYKSRAFTLNDTLEITWDAPQENYYTGRRLTDIRGDVRYTEPLKIGFSRLKAA